MNFYYHPLQFEDDSFNRHNNYNPIPTLSNIDPNGQGYIGKQISFASRNYQQEEFVTITLRSIEYASFTENDYYTEIREYTPLNNELIIASEKETCIYTSEFKLTI